MNFIDNNPLEIRFTLSSYPYKLIFITDKGSPRCKTNLRGSEKETEICWSWGLLLGR
jgi:hypothetical protein